jgi:hypothetical protein
MKPFFYSFTLVAIICLVGCGGPKGELNPRMREMISFIDVAKDKDGFMSMYFDPDAVQKAKESDQWSKMIASMPDEMLPSLRAELVAAQQKTPSMTYKGQVATYTFDGLPELSFVKLKGQWYLYHPKK